MARPCHLTRAKLAGLPGAVGLIQSLGQALPIRGESLDRVVCTLVFHHLPTPVKYATAREVYRVLRQGGRLLLADYGRPTGWLWPFVLRLAGVLDGWAGMAANYEGQVPDILREVGFQVAEEGSRYHGVSFLLATKVSA
ncbi:MAG: class I SAM-dependent methyltransferase [Chloroflexota bacterium]